MTSVFDVRLSDFSLYQTGDAVLPCFEEVFPIIFGNEIFSLKGMVVSEGPSLHQCLSGYDPGLLVSHKHGRLSQGRCEVKCSNCAMCLLLHMSPDQQSGKKWANKNSRHSEF